MLTTFDPDTNNNLFNLNLDQRLIFFSPLYKHPDHCVEPILPNKEVNICCRDVMMLIIIGVISQSAGQLVSRLASGAPLASDSGDHLWRQRQLLTWARTIDRDLRPGTNVWVTIWHQVATTGRWSVSWSAPDNIRFHKLYQSGVTTHWSPHTASFHNIRHFLDCAGWRDHRLDWTWLWFLPGTL